MLCIYYNSPNLSDIINEVSQVKIDSSRLADDTIEEFIETNSDKHIYINCEDIFLFGNKESCEKLKSLKKYPNWTLQIPLKDVLKYSLTTEIDNVNFNACKDLCNTYMFTDLIGQWEILDFVLSLEPSEVYITNILGFSLERVKNVCHSKGVKVRAYANIAQAAVSDIEAIKKFFIRPEDLWAYNDYLDGVELVGDKNQKTLYEIYKRGYWYGDLSEIIVGLDDSLDSRRLPQNFGTLRAVCNKRCITGSRCSVCRSMKQFAKEMEKTNSGVKPRVKE